MIDMKAAGAHEKAMAFLEAADEAGEKVVLHCSGGQGRTGLILAAWLVTAPPHPPVAYHPRFFDCMHPALVPTPTLFWRVNGHVVVQQVKKHGMSPEQAVSEVLLAILSPLSTLCTCACDISLQHLHMSVC
jgi:hypothetical protein